MVQCCVLHILNITHLTYPITMIIVYVNEHFDESQKFGTRPLCYWDSPKLLVVSFNNGNPTVLPGDTVRLLPGIIGSTLLPSNVSFVSDLK